MTVRPTIASPPLAFAKDIAAAWMLDPNIRYLNHGCFGARLRRVVDRQTRDRNAFEREPIDFLERERDRRIDEAKHAVGQFLGMTPANFGFVTNATAGVTSVLRSLPLGKGDHVLTTTHVYNAVRQLACYLTAREGWSISEVEVPFPCPGPDAVVEAIERGIQANTRLVIIDHVTSPTALVLPIERLIERLHARGIDVLVDGAHAPGMLDLDVESLGVAYYTGNLHKWVGAPPGAAFLHVRPDRQAAIHPNVISHFFGEGLGAEFAWQGTRDITPWLATAEAIDAMAAFEGGWPRIMAYNRDLARWAHTRVASALGITTASPADGSMLGSMVAWTLPDGLRVRWPDPASLHQSLRDDDQLEVPVFELGQHWILRASFQIYNTADDVEHLIDAVSRRLSA